MVRLPDETSPKTRTTTATQGRNHWLLKLRVPGASLVSADRGLLAVFALYGINNLRAFNRAFSPIPAAHLC
jgi:hypothetical protein